MHTYGASSPPITSTASKVMYSLCHPVLFGHVFETWWSSHDGHHNARNASTYGGVCENCHSCCTAPCCQHAHVCQSCASLVERGSFSFLERPWMESYKMISRIVRLQGKKINAETLFLQILDYFF